MTLDEATSTTMNRRKPSWREKENNRRRERRRRAISTKIYSTLRTQGNYKLPKHYDNNEVLKALCVEAGWIVEEDGTTYRKGCKAAVAGDGIGSSTQNTPLSSQNASPIPSYQVSPSSSSFPSPCLLNANKASNLIPYVGNASLPPLRISNSAPVTPPLYSPTKPIPMPSSFNHYHQHPYLYSFPFPLPFPFSAASAPPSPSHRHLYAPPTMPHFHQSGQWLNFQAFPPSVSSVPISPSPSPTFNFIQKMTNSEPVKPWVGETIHQEGLDDLELTLGSGKTPA